MKILDEVLCHIKKYCEENGKAQLEATTFNSASSLLNSIDTGVGMHLHRKGITCVDQLNQKRKFFIRKIGSNDVSPKLSDHAFQGSSLVFTIANNTFLVLANGQLPALAHRFRLRLLTPIGQESFSAPDGGFCYVRKLKWIKIHTAKMLLFPRCRNDTIIIQKNSKKVKRKKNEKISNFYWFFCG